MPKRMTPSQYNTMVRQAQNQRRRAINKYNQEVRQHNQKVKQATNKLNQEVRRHNQKVSQNVNKYNQEVRAYNSRIRANQQRIKNELSRLSRQSKKTQHVVFRTSVDTLQETYTRLEQRFEAQNLDPSYNRALDLSEREAANNLEVMNSLLGAEAESEQPTDELTDATLTDELRKISKDLDDRWRGAVFALNVRNPDAARHFCTSAREVFSQILEIKAPDTDVISLMPECERTDQGKPTRRAKIKFFLYAKGMTDETFEEFVEQDMENIIELFRVFNDGTHGSAGKFNLHQLSAIKKRVEDGILFLSQLVN